MKFWYLATPYSAYAEGLEAAHREAAFARKEVAYMMPGAVPERFVPRPER